MATSHPKNSSLPHRNSTGGPLPVLRLTLERANGSRRWRMSAGFLIHAALLATVLLLPVLVTEPLSSPSRPPDVIIVLPPLRGQPNGTPGVTGRNGYGTSHPPRVPDLSGRPQLPVTIRAEVGAGPEVGLGPGPVGLGVPGGSDIGVPGGTGPVVNPPAPQPIRVGGRLRAPRLLHRVEPEYPLLAQRAGIEGEVVLDAVLGADGRVAQVTVLRGHPALAAGAAAAVRQWVYEPTYLNDKPVPVALEIVVQFRLRR